MFEELDDDVEFDRFCRSLDELKESPQLYKHSAGFTQRIMAALPKNPQATPKPFGNWLKKSLSIAATIGLAIVYWKAQNNSRRIY